MSEQRKPEPATAVGQVRSGRLRYQAQAVPYVVLYVGDTAATIRQDGHESMAGITIEDLQHWPCIGVETPAGRVMVGERRQSPSGYARMVASVEGTGVRMPLDGDTGDDAPPLWPAPAVASWPLLPPLGPLEAAAPQAVREPAKPSNPEARGQGRLSGRCLRCGGLPCRLAIVGVGCEHGPGIAALAIPEPPSPRPDVVYTWEAWALP